MSINIGQADLDKCYVGSSEVSKIYWGSTQVYSKGSTYQYTQSGSELTLTNAPYTQSGSELQIN